MSIETNSEELNTEKMDAARAIITESPTLSKDEYAQQVVGQRGLTNSGKVVDIIDFLAAREAYLEDNAGKMTAVREKNPDVLREAMLVHSVRPDLEEK